MQFTPNECTPEQMLSLRDFLRQVPDPRAARPANRTHTRRDRAERVSAEMEQRLGWPAAAIQAAFEAADASTIGSD